MLQVHGEILLWRSTIYTLLMLFLSLCGAVWFLDASQERDASQENYTDQAKCISLSNCSMVPLHPQVETGPVRRLGFSAQAEDPCRSVATRTSNCNDWPVDVKEAGDSRRIDKFIISCQPGP